MFSDVLQNIEGVEIFPVISLVIFFVFFISVLIWTVRLDKGLVNKLSRLPFNDSKAEPIDGEFEND